MVLQEGTLQLPVLSWEPPGVLLQLDRRLDVLHGPCSTHTEQQSAHVAEGREAAAVPAQSRGSSSLTRAVNASAQGKQILAA